MTKMYVLFLSICIILSCGTITCGQNVIDKINDEFSESIKNFTLLYLGDSCPYNIPQNVPVFSVKNSGMFLCITIFEAGFQISSKYNKTTVDNKDFKVQLDKYFNIEKPIAFTQAVDINFCKYLADHSINATNNKQWIDAFNKNIKNLETCTKICYSDNSSNIDKACLLLNYFQEFIILNGKSFKGDPKGSFITIESNRNIIPSTLSQQNTKITSSDQIQNGRENSQAIEVISKIKTNNTVSQENKNEEQSIEHEQDQSMSIIKLHAGEKKEPVLEMPNQNADNKQLQDNDVKKLVTEKKIDVTKIEDEKNTRNDEALTKKTIDGTVEIGRKTENIPVENDDDGKFRFAPSKESIELEKSKLNLNDFDEDPQIPPVDDDGDSIDAGISVEPGMEEKVRSNSATNILKSDDSIGYMGQQFDDSEESHFFSYIFVMLMFCFVLYIVFHNKQKILALALEGRRGKHHRRRPNTANYRKLDSNLEEAVTSNCNTSASHVIY